MKQNILKTLLLVLITVAPPFLIFAQPTWPKAITTKSGVKISVYQPTPESLNGNKLKFRGALSILQKPGADLIFGAYWSDAIVNTDRTSRMVSLESMKVTNVKFPDLTDTSKINQLKTLLETEFPKWKLTMSQDALVAMIEMENPKKSDDIKNTPPKIIYKDKISCLIMIDGTPKLEKDTSIKMNRVINTSFLIIQPTPTESYYLYAGKYWYSSKSITEGWASTTKLPEQISELDKQIKAKKTAADKAADSVFKSPPAIVVSTEPAELIQSDGEANMKPIEGTQLLYVSNSDDNIFMDINSQMYFTLLSGRWFQSKTLQGTYEFVEPEKIPADFAKIPEGSDKDIVLASVPGTDAAREAVMDAQIPQTAKVDRKTATTEVKYDGEPKFEPIEGTNMEVAKNTSSTVIKDKDKYYAVKDGIWFMATLATGGLWAVANERPSQMEQVPASSEVYNAKYVEIYESTPDYVYVGYTPGYMGCYVYGPVVVYGTGYYYNPWYGPHYYPYPVTYGFGMAYNPYYGWSMGYGYAAGFFAYSSVAFARAAYWGCGGYRPPYCYGGYHGGYHGGYYGGAHVSHYSNTNINVNRNNNVYNGNKGVNTNDIKRNPSNTNRPSTQPSGGGRGNQASQQPANQPGRGNQAGQQPANQTGRGNQAGQQPANQGGNRTDMVQQPSNNNVRTDKSGNVYKQGNDGNWQQRNNNQWQNSNQQPANNQMDRQQQNSNRGQTRDNNFNSQGGGSRSYGGGGGSRGGGGGGRGGGGRR